MTRTAAMLLAPHATRLHSANPLHIVVIIVAALVIWFFLWTVTTPNPRRTR